MTPEEQSLRDEIKRRLDYYSPAIAKTDGADGLKVSLRGQEFVLNFVNNQGTSDRGIS